MHSTLHAEQEWSPQAVCLGTRQVGTGIPGREHMQGDAERPTAAVAMTKTGTADEAGGADRNQHKPRSFNVTLDDDDDDDNNNT